MHNAIYDVHTTLNGKVRDSLQYTLYKSALYILYSIHTTSTVQFTLDKVHTKLDQISTDLLNMAMSELSPAILRNLTGTSLIIP